LDSDDNRATDSDPIDVGSDEAGQRVDRFLAEHLRVPRNQIQQWIRAGRVTIDDRSVKVSRALVEGDVIVYNPPSRADAHDLTPEDGELTILHLDRDIVVLDKPADLVVHPGAGQESGTLVHRLLARFPEMAETGGPNRPGIVHRLDKDSTGVMVVARTVSAYQSLSEAFSDRKVNKQYLSIVYGTPKQNRGIIDQPIGRHPQKRKEMTVRPDGRPARTEYRVVAGANRISLLDIGIATGRTHQIRVHMKAIGHPLVGDPTYGEARWKGAPNNLKGPLKKFNRPALHAWKLSFEHPRTGESIEFTATPASDLVELWRQISGSEFPSSEKLAG
jgi:23S rRNA pseudouridine1911/1915/1917 synthase